MGATGALGVLMRAEKLAFTAGLAISGLLLSGCAVSKRVSGPNGEILHAIECSGAFLSMGDCIEKAGKICGSYGYEVIGGNQANLGYVGGGSQYGIFHSPYVQREMIIRCKGGPGAAPKSEAPKPSDGGASF